MNSIAFILEAIQRFYTCEIALQPQIHFHLESFISSELQLDITEKQNTQLHPRKAKLAQSYTPKGYLALSKHLPKMRSTLVWWF
jgi:hypothetical protein